MTKKNMLNATEVVDLCTKRVAALKKYATSATTQIGINGEILTVPQVIAIYQDCLDARTGLDAQRALVKSAMVATEAAELKVQTTEQPLKGWVVGMFGPDSQQAHDFGFPPRKKPVRTVVSKTQAVALNKATRAARHTMGPKQKQQIKGTITVPTAPAAPATSESPVAPAPVAPAPVAPAPVAVSPAPSSLPVNGVAAGTVTNGAASH